MRSLIKVSRDNISYLDVSYDNDGWADAKKYLPCDFDLVLLKRKDGRILKGWSVSNSWDGLRLKKTDEIVQWKREENV
jgi:hypothetical protein